MRTAEKRTISIILLFIVSTMLIGIFSSCGEKYVKAYWEYTPELEPLTQEQVDAFNRARFIYDMGITPEEYIAKASEDEKDEAIEAVEFLSPNASKNRLYLGTFNGTIVVCAILPLAEGVEIKLGENVFIYPNYMTIYVFNNGKIYDIEEAYEIGLLTDDDVVTIIQRKDKYLKARYGG